MRLSVGIIVTGLLLVLSHAVMAETLDRDTIIERLIKSYGGEDNLRKAEIRILNGQQGHVAFKERPVQTASPPQRGAMPQSENESWYK